MTEPTKAELQAENARLAEENRQLRELLDAVHEAAYIPRAEWADRPLELDRWHLIGTRIRDLTDPAMTGRHGPEVCARILREYAAEPADYKVRQLAEGSQRILDDLSAMDDERGQS